MTMALTRTLSTSNSTNRIVTLLFAATTVFAMFQAFCLTSDIHNKDDDAYILDNVSPSLHHHAPQEQPNGIQHNDIRREEEEEEEEEKVKIVAFTDYTYIPVAKWWYERMTNLSYTTHTLILIDQPAVQHFSRINNNATTTNKSSNNKYRFEVQLVDEGKRRLNKVRSLWYHRILYCLKQLQSGKSLLLTDVDNIFARYVPLRPFLQSSYDAIFALEVGFPVYIYQKQGFVLCGGMTFLKATNATITTMQKLLHRCDGGGDGSKRCDDQVEWNNMLFEEMEWNNTESKKLVGADGLYQLGFEGTSRVVTDFTAKVWDRDFAWRGEFSGNITCPSLEKNWVSMPSNLPREAKEVMRNVHGGVEGSISADKLARVKLWDIFCGRNGTNRWKDGLSNDEILNTRRDSLDEAIQAYKATF